MMAHPRHKLLKLIENHPPKVLSPSASSAELNQRQLLHIDLTLEKDGQTAWVNSIVYCPAFLKAKGAFPHIQPHIHLHFSS